MSAILGISSAVISGAFDGSYGVVMKATKGWEWENIWFLFSIAALGIFPLALALLAGADLVAIYREVPANVLWRTLLFGAGWGVGSVFFGLGLYLLGQSIAYTVMMGIIAVGGALIPMLSTDPSSVGSQGGLVILLSLAVTIVGVYFCGMAGKLRDDHFHDATKSKSFTAAFLVCLGGGIFSSMFNLAFHYGAPIAAVAASRLGESSTSFRANSPIWVLAMLGGFVPNLVYCCFQLSRKQTWGRFFQPRVGRYWAAAVLMGALFAAGITFYGVGASNLGKLGTTVAWLLYVATGILVANIWGVVCGEWLGAPAVAIKKMKIGSFVLVLSIVLVSYGNYLLP